MISGRTRAPGRLGALYPSLDLMPMGIGNYEPFGGTPDAPGAPEQTLIGVVQVTAPAGPYTVWAERAGTAPFAEQSPRNRLLYVLNDQQLAASEKMIGEPPAYLAVLTDRPGDSATVNGAFADGRYEWSKTEALYSQADPNRVPKMSFLHWGQLRPMTEWKGRTATERNAAARLGGILVFPVAVPVSSGDREAPQATFAEAFKIQFPGGGAFLPKVVEGPEVASNVRLIAQQEAAKGALMVLGILAGGALAAWAGYRLTRRAQGATA